MMMRFPGVKWIVHNGWYSYESESRCGWYVSSIPHNTIMPLNPDDLHMATVISTNTGCNHAPKPYPPNHPIHPPHCEEVFTHKDSEMLDRAMITVDTLAQRDALSCEFLPNGKVVRVNNVDGQVAYYEWDSSTLSWLTISDNSSTVWESI